MMPEQEVAEAALCGLVFLFFQFLAQDGQRAINLFLGDGQRRNQPHHRIGRAVDEQAALFAALDRYQGRCLNELPEFSLAAPSLENLAREIHSFLEAALHGQQVTIEVRVWEDCEAWASYEGPPG